MATGCFRLLSVSAGSPQPDHSTFLQHANINRCLFHVGGEFSQSMLTKKHHSYMQVNLFGKPIFPLAIFNESEQRAETKSWDFPHLAAALSTLTWLVSAHVIPSSSGVLVVILTTAIKSEEGVKASVWSKQQEIWRKGVAERRKSVVVSIFCMKCWGCSNLRLCKIFVVEVCTSQCLWWFMMCKFEYCLYPLMSK